MRDESSKKRSNRKKDLSIPANFQKKEKNPARFGLSITEHFHIIAVRIRIFHSPETSINNKLRAVIVNDPFHFFLEKK